MAAGAMLLTSGDASAVLAATVGLGTPVTAPMTSPVTVVTELAPGAVTTLLTTSAAGVFPIAGAIAVLTADTTLFATDWTGLVRDEASTAGATAVLTVLSNPVRAVVAVFTAVLAAVDAVVVTLLTPSAMISMKDPLLLLEMAMPPRPVALYNTVCVALTSITGWSPRSSIMASGVFASRIVLLADVEPSLTVLFTCCNSASQ